MVPFPVDLSLLSLLSSFPTLTTLHLDWSRAVPLQDIPLPADLPVLSNLVALRLSYCPLPAESLRRFVLSCPKLSELSLTKSPLSSDPEGLSSITNLPRLRSLSLRRCDLDAATVNGLIQARFLTELSLIVCNVSGGSSPSTASAITVGSNLQSVDMTATYLHPNLIASYLRMFPKPKPSLKIGQFEWYIPKRVYALDEVITVRVGAPIQAFNTGTGRDWIALSLKGSDPTAYFAWFWFSSFSSYNFSLPAPHPQGGDFEIRLYLTGDDMPYGPCRMYDANTSLAASYDVFFAADPRAHPAHSLDRL